MKAPTMSLMMSMGLDVQAGRLAPTGLDVTKVDESERVGVVPRTTVRTQDPPIDWKYFCLSVLACIESAAFTIFEVRAASR